MICPILSVARKEMKECLKEGCVFWVKEYPNMKIPRECAIVGINRNLLDIRQTLDIGT